MANSKIIIVEGPQGVGKTTITDYIRHAIPYTNLYRLSGTADISPAGKEKARIMYEDLLEYMEKLQNKSINLLFDRTFFTEEIYCRLGFKEYSFTDVFERLLAICSTIGLSFVVWLKNIIFNSPCLNITLYWYKINRLITKNASLGS